MRVLLINRGGLGDVLQMLPAIQEGSQRVRSLVVDCVVDERWQDIPNCHAAVDRVLTLPFSQWRGRGAIVQASPQMKLLKRQIRKYSYDAVLDLSSSWLSAWLSRHCDSTNFGLVCGDERRLHCSLFYRQCVTMDKTQHQVEQWRQLLASALGYEPSQGLMEYGLPLQQMRCSSRVGQDVVLLFSSRYEERQYPAELARQLIQRLASLGYSLKLAWRDPKSRGFAEALVPKEDHAARVEVLPALKLSGLMAVLAEAKAVITVDNGLSHLAAAAAVPTVHLVGIHSNIAELAYGGHQVLMNSRQHLDDLLPEQITDVLRQLLHSAESGGQTTPSHLSVTPSNSFVESAPQACHVG